MKHLLISSLVALLISIAAVQPALATDYFAGNDRPGTYGVMSDISLPSTPLTIYSGQVAAWVGTENYNNNWVETGWGVLYGAAPWSFTEGYLNQGQYHVINYVSQLSYGNTSNYKVRYFYGTWYCYINGVFQGGWGGGGLPTPPHAVRAYGEVQGTSANDLFAHFNYLAWVDSLGNWYTFDQANWRQDSPYGVAYAQTWNYYTLRY